jgi:acylphosphatase
MTDPLHVVRLRVRGRVQGVAYRAWTADMAEELGLSGWVRNRRDGSVEALFAGTRQAVEEMAALCRKGPRTARVTAVEIEEEGGEAPRGFDILATA